MTQPSSNFPVDRLHMRLEWTSLRLGPFFEVVIIRSAPGKVLDIIPEPMSDHLRSLARISWRLVFCPGWVNRLHTGVSAASASSVGGGRPPRLLSP